MEVQPSELSISRGLVGLTTNMFFFSAARKVTQLVIHHLAGAHRLSTDSSRYFPRISSQKRSPLFSSGKTDIYFFAGV